MHSQKTPRQKTNRARPMFKHLMLMTLCCAAPLLLTFAIAVSGIHVGFHDSLLPLLCPLLMLISCGYLMYCHRRDKKPDTSQ
ncbi:MAG: hypothetical protein AAF404_07375 [Pseudomonadota bacterium]